MPPMLVGVGAPDAGKLAANAAPPACTIPWKLNGQVRVDPPAAPQENACVAVAYCSA